MAKGDSVVVRVATGNRDGVRDLQVVATKAGRFVKVSRGPKWITVDEMTRPTSANAKGTPAGHRVTVPVESVISIEETPVGDD